MGAMPVIGQFFIMQVGPLLDKFGRTPGQFSFVYVTGVDEHSGVIPGVNCVKMRRSVISPVNVDRNPLPEGSFALAKEVSIFLVRCHRVSYP